MSSTYGGFEAIAGADAAGLLRLLQLSSACLPIGSYAYSQGLEQAVERRWVEDADGLLGWLEGVAEHSLAQSDLPLLLRSHAAWQEDDPARARELAEWVLAQRESRELVEEERHLGRALARVLFNLGSARAAAYVGSQDASYVVMFGLAAVDWSIPPGAAALGYLYAWTENQIAAANRLLPLGQIESQRVLSTAIAAMPKLVDRARSLTDDEIGNLAPGLALASAWHEEQYSRMFRS